MTREMQASRASSLLTRAVRVARTQGIRALSQRAIDRLKTGCELTLNYLLVFMLNPELAPASDAPNITIQILQPEDYASIEELVRIFEVPTNVEYLHYRLQQNEVCFLARVQDRFVGYLWVRMAGEVEEYGHMLFTLQPDECYAHAAFIIHEVRGQGIFPALKLFAGRVAAEQYGKKKLVSYVRSWNRASLNGSRKLGVYRAGIILQIKIFGWRSQHVFRHRPVLL